MNLFKRIVSVDSVRFDNFDDSRKGLAFMDSKSTAKIRALRNESGCNVYECRDALKLFNFNYKEALCFLTGKLKTTEKQAKGD